jgi:membrane-associated phospholipid phosphatase
MPNLPDLRRQILWILIPALLYITLFLLRPVWFVPRCAVVPTPCLASNLNLLDQFAVSQKSVFADFCSNILQNLTGAFAFLLPWLLLGPGMRSFQLNLNLLSLTTINGVVIEVVRALVQRPRPLVLHAPLTNGLNIHEYTSFYSGHTSFVALATLFSWIWSRRMLPERKNTQTLLACFYGVLTLTTGVLRVLGGRHYPTDVLGGLIFGSGLAWIFSKVKMKAEP